MRSKLAIPALVMAGLIGTTSVSFAQVRPEKEPVVESARAARAKALYRERTILRPGTTTGMSRGTPNGRHNWYQEPGN